MWPGSVVFTAGDWTETVKLNADGVATVTAPEGALGKVSKITAAYGGYTDNLVNVSDDAIEQTPDPDPTPDPTPDPDPTPAPTTKPGTTTTKKTAKKAAVVVNTGANVKGIALVAASWPSVVRWLFCVAGSSSLTSHERFAYSVSTYSIHPA